MREGKNARTMKKKGDEKRERGSVDGTDRRRL